MTETALSVQHLDTDHATTLWHRYEQQREMQPCHLLLDLEDGTFTADYNPELEPRSSSPASVWLGRELWWQIPCLTAAGANELLDELAPLAVRVLAGASIEWDGSNSRGYLDTDADAASKQIAARCGSIDALDLPHVAEVDAGDWFAGIDLGVTADTTDTELSALADQLADEATQAGTGGHPAERVVVWGLDEFLQSERSTAREAVESELEDVAGELDELTAKRDALVRRCSAWTSTRALGELAGVSHTQIRRITTRDT